MKRFILCTLLGADNKNIKLLVNLKENESYFDLQDILNNQGYSDFKVMDWVFMDNVTIING